jgi:NAD-dependent SIR2 family protein deacetylase
MALFDTKCTKCGAIERDVVHASSEQPPACSACGAATEHIWERTPRAKFFHSGWYEHLAPDPLYFDDRGKLREYCNVNDLRMEQLE